MSKIREHLEDANRHLAAAIQHHDEGNHHAARYRVGQAKSAVEGALGAELASGGAAVDPRAAAPLVGRLLASIRAAAQEQKR